MEGTDRKRYRRIGLVGDIHAEDRLLEIALETLRSRGVELVAATGDIADGVGSVDRCCTLLETHNAVAVRGNHDRWFLAGTMRNLPNATALDGVTAESRRFLAELPETIELATTAGPALLCHGLGLNDMGKVTPDDYGYALESNDDLQALIRLGAYRFILNGHSHRPMVRAFGPLVLINAGTLARHRDPCFLELDFETKAGLVFSFDGSGGLGAPVPLSIDGARLRESWPTC